MSATHDDLRKGFHEDLAEVRSEVVRMAAAVTDSVPRATGILLDQDLEGAEYVILADDEMDARALEVEDRCIQLLALQAPVASDLRQLVAALKMVPEIERSADLVVNICKAARRIYGHELDPKLRGVITKMGEQAAHLWTRTIEAYVENDSAKAAAIDDMDSYLDSLQRQFIQLIFESHAAGRIDLQVAVQLAVVARFYERIGDHAVNISEKVRYIVDGWTPELVGAVRHRARLGGAVPAEPSAVDTGAEPELG